MSSNMEYPAPTTIRAHEAWQAHIGIRGFAEMGSYFVFRPWADRLAMQRGQKQTGRCPSEHAAKRPPILHMI